MHGTQRQIFVMSCTDTISECKQELLNSNFFKSEQDRILRNVTRIITDLFTVLYSLSYGLYVSTHVVEDFGNILLCKPKQAVMPAVHLHRQAPAHFSSIIIDKSTPLRSIFVQTLRLLSGLHDLNLLAKFCDHALHAE